jgi:LPXTG-motif cell wall-anchored protein
MTLAVVAIGATLSLPLLGTSAAIASTPLASIEFSDGTTTSDELTVAPGSPVTIVINDASTGEYTFEGCVGLETYDYATGVYSEATFLSASPTTITWTAGTSAEAFIANFIDLSPEGDTGYYVYLFDTTGDPDTCENIWFDEDNYDGLFSAYLDVIDPETMNLTGTPKLGNTVAVVSKVPGSLVGNDFDLWACPDQTIYPRDDADVDGANGDCYGPLIQTREGDSTQFLLGYDPARDGTSAEERAAAEAEWAEFCGKYFIVHDYPGGGHSNWIGPIVCEDDAPALAETGADATTGAVSLAALAAMLVGGVLLTLRRRASASA